MATDKIAVTSTPRFNSDLEDLAKKYPRVIKELTKLVRKLKKGNRLGDRMRGVGGALVYEERMPNPDARKGKSGGFRVVYHLGKSEIRLLVICSRPKCSEAQPAKVARILRKLDLS